MQDCSLLTLLSQGMHVGQASPLAPDSTSYPAAGGAYYRVRAARGAVRSRPSNAVSVP